MDNANFFHGKFDLAYHNHLKRSVDASRCQRVMSAFMVLVERNDEALLCTEGFQLMMEFCSMVQHEDVWPLAEMVIFQLRMTKEENNVSCVAPFTCLDIVLTNINRLPVRPDWKITVEQKMLRSRYKNSSRLLLSGGHLTDHDVFDGEEKMVDELVGKIKDLRADGSSGGKKYFASGTT